MLGKLFVLFFKPFTHIVSCPDPIPLMRMGSGHETNLHMAILVTYQHLELLLIFPLVTYTALTDSADFYFRLESENWPFTSFV